MCAKTQELPYIVLARLTLHEELLYATREIGRVVETGLYLHNYALTYAFRLVNAPIRLMGKDASARTPEEILGRYRTDLSKLKGIYVTPANPHRIFQSFMTYSARDEAIRVTKAREELSRKNVPEFGHWLVIMPGSSFECFLFLQKTAKMKELPVFIRLGKTSSKTEVEYKECKFRIVDLQSKHCEVNFPLNPKDLSILPISYDMESMRPTPLYTRSIFEIDRALRIEYGDGRVMFLPIGMEYFAGMNSASG